MRFKISSIQVKFRFIKVEKNDRGGMLVQNSSEMNKG